MPVGIFADVAGLLRLVEIAGAIKADDLIVRATVLKGISHVCQHLTVRELLLLLRLSDGKAGARNLTLVAIKDRQRYLPE